MREYSWRGEHNVERAMQIERGKRKEERIVRAAKTASAEERPKEFENVSNNKGRKGDERLHLDVFIVDQSEGELSSHKWAENNGGKFDNHIGIWTWPFYTRGLYLRWTILKYVEVDNCEAEMWKWGKVNQNV